MSQKIKRESGGGVITLRKPKVITQMKIATDKMLHFIVSLLLAIVASTLLANVIYKIMPDNPGARTATAYGAALFATMAIGIAKEMKDRRQTGNHFCWKDIAADAAGAALGSLGAFVSYLL